MKTYQRLLINKVGCSYFTPNKIRRKILKMCGITLFKNSRVSSDCFFDTNKVFIGKDTFINRFCQFHDGGHGEKIVIKDNCMIAMNVNFCTVSHDIEGTKRRCGRTFTKEIIVENGCWIGANTVILPGVTIGEGCVIGAGSVVTKNCEPNGLYAGNPAKRIKDLD